MNRSHRTRSSRVRTAMLLALALSVPAALPLGTAAANHFSDTEELNATDNVGAAIAFSASTFPEGAPEVVLGRDDTFPDSLASGMAQATRPLLLTASAELSEPTKEELARLGAQTVHVLGGDQAVQPAVVTALEAEGYTVQRHAGPTRVDTAVAVAKSLGAAATSAIMARAFGTPEDETRAFADSLAAGGWAAAAAMPVLLTETEKLSDAAAAYLKESSITEVFVVGGQSAVSEVVVTQLTAQGLTVKRVSGPTRFHTALAIAAERGFATAADADKVIVAEGQAPDAWAAGFAAAGRSAKENAPIVLAVGTELSEPTEQFLSGGDPAAEPDPDATTEPDPDATTEPDPNATTEPDPDATTEPDPNATTEPDPNATTEPDPDATTEPDPDATTEPDPDAEAGEGRAALLCAPMLAAEACDAAATALGQVAGAGEQLIEFAVPAVSRFDYAIGQIADPLQVQSVSVTGCGYTDHRPYVNELGEFYLLMTEPAGTCSAQFALETGAGLKQQTTEFNVGEDFVGQSALPVPELVSVRPVTQNEEGVVLRFLFDEPVAPGDAIDAGKFRIQPAKTVNPTDQTWKQAQYAPTSIQRDPVLPSAVLAVFRSAEYHQSTLAYAMGGRPIMNPATAAGNRPRTDAEVPTSGTTRTGCPTPPARCRLDDGELGAVRDFDGYPNATGQFGTRRHDLTSAGSDAPELRTVGSFRDSDSSMLFTFSEPVKLPAPVNADNPDACNPSPLNDSHNGQQTVGRAQVVLVDGTVKRSNCNGWSTGPDASSLRVSFAADGLTAAEFETVRRAYVRHETVEAETFSADYDKWNIPIGVVVSGGGITPLPDFVNFESPSATEATFVFEEELDKTYTMTPGNFVVVTRAGNVQEAATPVYVADAPRKVKITFSGIDASDPIVYYAVLPGAVKSFNSGRLSFADAIPVTTPEVYPPGITTKADIKPAASRAKAHSCSVVDPLNDDNNGEFRLDYNFHGRARSADVQKGDFLVWFTGAPNSAEDDPKKPYVLDMADTTYVKSLPPSPGATKISFGPDPSQECKSSPTPGTSPGNPGTFWTNVLLKGRAKYVEVVAGAHDIAQTSYPHGAPLAN